MPKFETLWKIVKIFLVIQIINAIMDYYVWIEYGFLVPSWTIASINVFYVLLIVGIKVAQEREKNRNQSSVYQEQTSAL